ncbi:MAG: GntR family transcriptional regulator [Hyphomicrobiales bacterium]
MAKAAKKTRNGKGTGARKTSTRRPRGTGGSFVYDSLKSKILNLELKPGTLLDETELSRSFKLSRSPVREALIRLSAEGLVEALRNRTSIVAPFDFSVLPAYFDAMQLLYRLSARLAAAHRTAAGLANLRDIEERLEQAHRDADILGIVQLNRDFHTAVAEMSGNPFIVTWMKSLLDQGQRVFRLYILRLDDKVPVLKLRQHVAMIEAIAAGDPEAAEAAGKADAETLIEEVVHFLGKQPTASLSLNPAARPAA